MITLYHVTPYRNLRLVKSVGLVPKKGKRGIFGSEGANERRVYLFVDRDTAEDAMTNWFLDEYPNDRWFAIVQVRVPKSTPLYEDPEVSGSIYTIKRIPPQSVSGVEKIYVGESD